VSYRDLIVVDDDGNVVSNRGRTWEPGCSDAPWWGGLSRPNPTDYTDLERELAKVLANQPPLSEYDPAWALPLARLAKRTIDLAVAKEEGFGGEG